MSLVEEVVGDLLTTKTTLIAHQANCVSLGARGLANAIFQEWPASNCYARRDAEPGCAWANEATRAAPGTIRIDGRVVHMFAQWAPGAVGQYTRYPAPRLVKETRGVRAGWFVSCLFALEQALRDARSESKLSVAFPRYIGCDLAGGDWEDYRYFIIQFAERVKDVATVSIVQLPDVARPSKRAK